MPQTILLSGHDLTPEEVESVARWDAPVVLSPEARKRMAASRATITDLVEQGEPIYGVTTGFGDLAMKRIAPADVRRLQENLLVSHAVGVGPAHA
ncbi:MAG: aromatic amino acid lyase, partial [Candidatus Limnocylindrales bacterium]